MKALADRNDTDLQRWIWLLNSGTCMNKSWFSIFVFIFLSWNTLSWASDDAGRIREIYESTKDSIFRVQSGGGHGTGFLVDEEGLIATNSHVIRDSTDLSVFINSDLRVPAVVVQNDVLADLAIISVNPKAVKGISPLSLSAPRSDRYSLIGETVLAIGFPLSQGRTVTHGVVSNIQEDAIISDVNINPGNSGGPLLTLADEVVGVNTFLESGVSGPGISGVVDVSELFPVIERAKASNITPPRLEKLPVIPSVSYPVGGRNFSASFEAGSSQYLGVQRCGGKMMSRGRMTAKEKMIAQKKGPLYATRFLVAASTPVSLYRPKYEKIQRRLARRKHKLEAAGKTLPPSNAGQEVFLTPEWQKYVSNTLDPVVTVLAIPKLEPTGASAVSTFLVGTPTQAFTWKGEVFDLSLLKSGEKLTEIQKGINDMPSDGGYHGIPIVDKSTRGMLTLPYEYFEPEFKAGMPRSKVVLEIDDLRHPGGECDYVFDQLVLERVWVDFEGYRDFLAGMSAELKLERVPGR